MTGASRVTPLFLVAVLVTGLLVACGSSSKPQLCSDVKNLQSSVNELRDISPTGSALVKIKDGVTNVGKNVQTVVSSAKSQYSSQVADLQSAYSSLKTNAQKAGDTRSAQDFAAVATSFSQLGTATKNLASAVQNTC
jgi:outer membrane murein-binding lipoprotein Lpp